MSLFRLSNREEKNLMKAGRIADSLVKGGIRSYGKTFSGRAVYKEGIGLSKRRATVVLNIPKGAL